jgi:ankyrin repeat protein
MKYIIVLTTLLGLVGCYATKTSLLKIVETGSGVDVEWALKNNNSKEQYFFDKTNSQEGLLFFAAAYNSDTKVIDVLIKAGLSVNERDKMGRTPLMFAVAYGHSIDVVELLVKDGADPKAKDKAGKSVLGYLCDNPSFKDYLNGLTIYEKMGGISVSMPPDKPQTPVLTLQDLYDRAKTLDQIDSIDVAVKLELLSIGSSEADALRLARPNNINTTRSSTNTREQWVYEQYGKTIYLYFDNGILTAVQD